MKKTILPLFLLLSALSQAGLSQANTPLDYCERQLERVVETTYAIEDLTLYRGYLREVLNHSFDALQGYVDANDGSMAVPIAIPLALATDILRAETDDAGTRRLLDGLRARYQASPGKPLANRDFQNIASRVLAADTATQWKKCKTICQECRANVGHKQNGIAYRILGRENQVFAITFTYLPERETDPPGVVVTGVTVRGGAVHAPVTIQRGTILHRYDDHIQAFRRTDPETHVTVEIDLEGREGLEILVTDLEPNPLMPVGSTVSSILAWEDYARATGDRTDYDPKTNRWAPCDGRNIQGSALGKLTGRAKAPDLRGVFIRGMNRFATDEPGAVSDKWKDPSAGRIAGGPAQRDKVGGHRHAFKVDKRSGTVHADHARRDFEPVTPLWRPNLWHVVPPRHGEIYRTESNPTGEARPKNVAMHYYIKIN